MPKKVKPEAGKRETIPFDEALRRLVNTPPKHKKGGKSGAGSGDKPKRNKANSKKAR